MRVLHVLNSIERSGAEMMLAQAAPLLRERGVDLHALATGASSGPFAAQLARTGFSVHHLPFRPCPAFVADFRRLVRRGRFDVVHIHTERAFFWYALAARLAGVRRIVRTVHGTFDFRGHLQAERWVQRRVARRFLGVRAVAVGRSVQIAEQDTYGLRPLLIPNWTDSSVFSPAEPAAAARARRRLAISADAILFVSVGSCQRLKNHAGIIRALPVVLTDCPGARYLHVGEGESEESERRLARELGVADRVRFVGQRDDVCAILQASDVFLMPSVREGLPVSCLEAMSCGLPVIAGDIPAFRDLVVDGVTGILVRNDQALAQAMKRVCGDARLRAAMGAAGRRRVLAEFSLKASVERYLDLYRGERPDEDAARTPVEAS